MKSKRNYLKVDESDSTVVRRLPDDSLSVETASQTVAELEAIMLPHPDETLIIDQNESLFDGIPLSNPFCVRASSLLSLVPKLRAQPINEHFQDLYSKLVREIEEFEALDPQAGLSKKQNQIASYLICALLDETILNTPWGRENKWQERSLLQRFHKNSHEGKRFFNILKQLLQHPKQYIHLIELAYICLSLGYEGIYRKIPNGPGTIAQHRLKLFELIQKINGPVDHFLSGNWQGISNTSKPLMFQIPAWVSVGTVGVLLMLIYFGIIYFINQDSDRVTRHIDLIAQKENAIPSAPPMRQEPVSTVVVHKIPIAPPKTAYQNIPKQTPKAALDVYTLRAGLAHEISQNKIRVLDGPSLRISNIFRSGSDQVKEEFTPLLAKIAKVLMPYEVRILVIGHSDNQPMFSGRFPSNWHLSEARAKSVANHLARNEAMAERIRFEGHGASEPVAANDTEQHRALNRRIDIHIR